MSQIFDRLGNLIKSAFSGDSDDFDFSSTNSNPDPDMKAAWDELNDFLNEDDFEPSSSKSTGEQHRSTSSYPQSILADYVTIGIPAGTAMIEVKKAYKQMAIKYHPDRFASNPEKMKNATEMMKKLNMAYSNIKKYEAENK